LDVSTLFSGHTLNPPMHTQPSAFLTLLPLTAEGFAICCRACCRNESTLHPPSCCHPSWDDEQAGQLAFHMPHSAHTHCARCPRDMPLCALSLSWPSPEASRFGAAPGPVSAWQFCTSDSASTGCQICPLHVERTTMALDGRSGGHWPERDRRRTSVSLQLMPAEESPWQFVSVMPSHSSQPLRRWF
jgi:hypothetical protein